jgi:hypothetical protein
LRAPLWNALLSDIRISLSMRFSDIFSQRADVLRQKDT